MSKLFGTDGVRGIAGSELTCELAYKLGRAGAYVLSKQGNSAKFLIGKDSRISGDMLECALMSGITSVGASCYCAEIISTPAIAYLTKNQGFNAGVMISASHNPMEYNGIKFFDNKGMKLDDAIQDEIEDIILNDKYIPTVTGDKIGTVHSYTQANDIYISYLATTTTASLSGKKIVLDCANGASYFVAPKVFEKLGATVIAINNTPNGTNINDKCGSTHIESVCKKVKETNADCGFAYDGDADRLIAIDENGEEVNGDRVIAIFATYLHEKGRLKNNTAVATIMSNMGLFKALEAQGIKVATTKVGDRYVLEEMLKCDYNIGGEQSGHIIFLDYATTGDGVLSSLQLATIMVEKNQTMSSLKNVMQDWPQVLINAKVTSGKQKTYPEYDEINKKIDELNKKYEGNGRLVIRPSGTEPVIRVMIEGQDTDQIKKDAQDLVDLIQSIIK